MDFDYLSLKDSSFNFGVSGNMMKYSLLNKNPLESYFSNVIFAELLRLLSQWNSTTLWEITQSLFSSSVLKSYNWWQ